MRNLAIVLPTYNRKGYLLEALRAFLREELPPNWKLTLIVVDDGGSDNTREALDEAGLSSKVTYLYQTNSERAVARNRGAREALSHFKADWLLFFDSDDLIVPGALMAYLELAESCASEVVAVYGEIEIWVDQTAPTLTRAGRKNPSGDLARRVLEKPILPLGATLVRAWAYEKIGGFHEERAMIGSEDFHFLVRLAWQGPILNLQQKTVFYRQHGANTKPENYLRSTECAVRELESALREKFKGKDFAQAQAQLSVLAKLGQIGALNQPGYRHLAFEAWLALIKQFPNCTLSWRCLRLFLSLCKGSLLDLVSARLPLRE